MQEKHCDERLKMPIGELRSLIVALNFLCFATRSDAENSCSFQKEIGERTRAVFAQTRGEVPAQTELVLNCTEKEHVVKVTLQDTKTKRAVQTFYEKQYRFYLQATTPDIDNDGIQDLVLPIALGNPDILFKAWRYDPTNKKFVLVLDDSGLAFFRSKSGDVVTYSKASTDLWRKTIYAQVEKKLKPKYEIDIPAIDEIPTGCHYFDVGHGRKRRIAIPPISLTQYCHIGVDQEVGLNFFAGIR
jgi:hypothetical protein